MANPLADIFAAAIGGADSQDIDQFKQRVSGNDYWRMAARPLFNTQFQTATWSPAQALATTAGAAFLASALNAIGQRSEASQLEAVAPSLPSLYANPLTTPTPEGVDPEAFAGLRVSALTKQAQLDSLLGSTLVRDLFGKEDTGDANKRSVLSAVAQANSPQESQRILKTAQDIGLISKDLNISTPVSSAEEAPTIKLKELFPTTDSSPESIQTKYNRVLQEQLNKGVPGGAAATIASQITEAERKANIRSVDKAEQARTVARTFDDLIATAEIGIEGAGKTGGPAIIAGPREFLSKVAAATVGGEQLQKQSAQTLLDSIRPDIIKIVRTKGVGQMSDREMNAYLQAGPSSQNLPEANREIIQKMRNLQAYQSDYADFLDSYQSQFGSMQGAEKLWDRYRRDNPPIINQNGNLIFNQGRTPWQDWIKDMGSEDSPVNQAITISPADQKARAKEILRSRGIAGY